MRLQNLKGGLLLEASTDSLQGELTYYNVTQFTIKRHEDKPVYAQVESSLVREAFPVTGSGSQGRQSLSEIGTSTHGNLILVNSHLHSDRLLMYEFTMPYLDQQGKGLVEVLTSEEARAPLVIIVAAGVLFYHLYYKEGAFFRKKDALADRDSGSK